MVTRSESTPPEEIDRVLAEVIAKKERGEAIDVQGLLAEHRDIAESLIEYFANAELFGDIFAQDAADAEVDTSSRVELVTKNESRSFNFGSDPDFRTALPAEVVDGSRPFGRYRIERLLGEGGMGAVYLAHDSILDRKVALKTPKVHAHDAARLSDRFLREAKAAANLHHRNICPVHDVGRLDGVDYLTMAYIAGKPLSRYIKPGSPVAQRPAAQIIRKLAIALQAAHDSGVIHRDLKPSNILIDAEGQPVVMDFGLAGQIETSSDSRLTKSGHIVGTPAYMSPEQARGDKDKIGPRSDIYSLGVVLFEMLTGRLPYQGSAAEVMVKILVGTPPDLRELRPEIDPDLERICMRMMSRSRSARYASMKEVADELAEVIRRLRLDDPPKPPVCTDETSKEATANQTAEELAAIRSIASSSQASNDGAEVASGRIRPMVNLWLRVGAWLDGLDTRSWVALVTAVVLTIVATGGSIVYLIWNTPTSIVTAENEADDSTDETRFLASSGEPKRSFHELMKPIYDGMRIESARAIGAPFHVGDPVHVSFDLANRSNQSLSVPLNSESTPPAYTLGCGRYRIERQRAEAMLPQESILAEGDWETVSASEIKPAERRPYRLEIDTNSFSSGHYLCHIEYAQADGEVIQVESVEFSLAEKTPQPAPPFVDTLEEWGGRILGVPPKEANDKEQTRAWSIAPRETRAMSFVRNMQDLSDKLDRLAKIIGREPPHALAKGMAATNIDAGLKYDGTLMWLYGPPKDGWTPVLGMVPTTNHQELIRNMTKVTNGKPAEVLVDSDSYHTVELEKLHYSAFAPPASSDWLTECWLRGGGFDQQLGTLNGYLDRQDIGFILSKEGTTEKIEVRLPFSDRNLVIPPSMTKIAEGLFAYTGFKAVAGGTEVRPEEGIRVSVASAIDNASDVGKWSGSMELTRDQLLESLPNGPMAMVVGVATCQQWNQWIEDVLHDQLLRALDEQNAALANLDLSSLKGITLMVSAIPGVNRAEIARQLHVQIHVTDAKQALRSLRSFLDGLSLSNSETLRNRFLLSTAMLANREALTIKVAQAGDPTPRIHEFSIATLDDDTIVVQGGGLRDLEKTIAKIKEKDLLIDNPSIAATRDLIAAECQQVVLLDAYRLALLAARSVQFDVPIAAGIRRGTKAASDRKQGPAQMPSGSMNPFAMIWRLLTGTSSSSPRSSQQSNREPNQQANTKQPPKTEHDSTTQGANSEKIVEGPALIPLSLPSLSAWKELVPLEISKQEQIVQLAPVVIQNLLQLLDAPPMGVGGQFQPSLVELNVVATEDWLVRGAKNVDFAKLVGLIEEALSNEP